MSTEASEATRIVEIVATVELQSDAERRERLAGFRRSSSSMDSDRRERVIGHMEDPLMYTMYVRLAAHLSDGRQVSAGVRDFSFGGPRQGVAAIHHRYRGPKLSDDPDEEFRLLQETYRVGLTDVQDWVNQMLGRDPEQHRPPRLSWQNLLAALSDAGVPATEQDLIDAPLMLDLSDDVKAEIGAD